jgi:hypothetical protein
MLETDHDHDFTDEGFPAPTLGKEKKSVSVHHFEGFK